MWKSQIIILDKRLKKDVKIEYNFPRCQIKKYKDLYKDLDNLLERLKYDKKQRNIDKTQISFVFKYYDKEILIDDWNKYILNQDLIIIIIDEPFFVLYEETTGIPIIKAKKQKDLYFYYNKYLKNKMKSSVLLKYGNRLVDVLDTNENCLNQCINRLIHIRDY